MVWCGVVWCGVVWCGVVWCGVVRDGVTLGDRWLGGRPLTSPHGAVDESSLTAACCYCAVIQRFYSCSHTAVTDVIIVLTVKPCICRKPLWRVCFSNTTYTVEPLYKGHSE